MARIAIWAISAACILAFAGCSQGESSGAQSRSLEQIVDAGTLRVVTRNAPTSYYLDRHKRPAGPEQALTAAFAQSLGVKIEYTVKNSIHGVLDTLAAGKADMAAAGLSVTPGRKERFRFAASYKEVQQQVVCNAKSAQPENVAALSGVSLTVIDDSSYAERLTALKTDHSDLHWNVDEKVGTEQLLHRVWENQLDCTVADSNIVDINRRYYPQLKVSFDLADSESLAWAMPQDADALAKSASEWLARKPGKQARRAIESRYYAYLPEFDFVDRRALVRRIDSVLPRYDRLFESAGKEHALPPLLMAAQAYQESKWDPKAKSPTGVRGLMMLTRRTAKAMGVENRLDPAQSVRGGAKYLDKMRGHIDESVPARDRLFMALAAYNIGLAHLRDAQKLAGRLGKNAKSWADLKSVLPLLADKRYYPSLKYGYARGTEPVRYIGRIRDYEDVIRRHVESLAQANR